MLPAVLWMGAVVPMVAVAGQDAHQAVAKPGQTRDDAAASDAADLAAVQVKAYVDTAEGVRHALGRVAGATSLVEAAAFRDAPTDNLEDVVDFVPGVYAQGRSGPESRLSIRGSGISIPFAVKGVRLLRNGLPIMEADGWYHSQLIEPLNLRYAEVYRGANALQYGASTLGGAINMVTHTGYTAPLFALRLEAGADGYLHPQIASGNVLGDGWDYFVSASNQQSDGFRAHSRGDHDILSASIGYRQDSGAETRLHFHAADSSQQLIGALTRAELAEDIAQGDAGEFISYQDARSENDFRQFRLDLQHRRQIGEDGKLDVGLFYEIQDVHHPLPFVLIEKNDLTTWGASLRMQVDGQLLGLDHSFTWGGLWMRGSSDDTEFAPLGGLFGEVVVEPSPPAEPRSLASDVATGELFAQDSIALSDALNLIVGAQFSHAERRLDIDVAGTPQGDRILDNSFTGFSPKLGLLWQADEQMQVFGNLSRSFEPPVLYDFKNANGVLDAQTATTAEFGARGSGGNWSWQLALYHARVKDEILSAEEPPNSGQFVTANADTLHSGVEFGLHGSMPVEWAGADQLELRLAWTYNHFRFDDNASFGGNELPGIPRQFGRFELLYEHPSGFYAGPNVQLATGYYVDYANTLEADSYTVVGFRTGYHSGAWSLFLEGVNLGDEVYASNTGVIDDAGGADQAVFIPGRPRAVFAGFEANW